MIVQVIIPVMIVILGGYLFGRFTNVDHLPISKFSMTVLSPALIFSFLVRNSLTSTQMFQVVTAVLIFAVLLILITGLVMRVSGQRRMTKPALLSTVFPNSASYGLPILLLAYGEEAYSLGIVIIVIDFILMFSLGVYFATSQRSSWRKSLIKILRIPTTYASTLAIIVNVLNVRIPDFLYNPVKLVGDATVPVVLLLIGIQLSRTKFKGYLKVTLISSMLRLVVAPVIIFFIVYFMGIEGMMAKVLILQRAMPTAIVMTIIATEYKAHEDVVANTTFLSSLLGFFTISSLLYFLDFWF